MLAGGCFMSSLAQFLFNLGQVIEQYGKRIEQGDGRMGDKAIMSKGIKLQRFACKILPHEPAEE